jgi:D-2-hydroxyacid dehydrogenase (NADP+)
MHATQMGEMVLAQMLVLARDVPRSVRSQRERAWERWYPRVLHGKCVGVVGLGISGREVGRVCRALGMHVIGVSRSRAEDGPFDEVYGYDAIARVASLADFLVVTASHRPDTDRLIDADVLRAMKPSAYLINVARGRIVDEDALVDALRARDIAGAALDVFRVEPLPDSSPLWRLPNVFLTSHLAGRSEHYVEAALGYIRPNLSCYLAGAFDAMTNRVDANAGRS